MNIDPHRTLATCRSSKAVCLAEASHRFNFSGFVVFGIGINFASSFHIKLCSVKRCRLARHYILQNSCYWQLFRVSLSVTDIEIVGYSAQNVDQLRKNMIQRCYVHPALIPRIFNVVCLLTVFQ